MHFCHCPSPSPEPRNRSRKPFLLCETEIFGTQILHTGTISPLNVDLLEHHFHLHHAGQSWSLLVTIVLNHYSSYVASCVIHFIVYSLVVLVFFCFKNRQTDRILTVSSKNKHFWYSRSIWSKYRFIKLRFDFLFRKSEPDFLIYYSNHMYRTISIFVQCLWDCKYSNFVQYIWSAY